MENKKSIGKGGEVMFCNSNIHQINHKKTKVYLVGWERYSFSEEERKNR